MAALRGCLFVNGFDLKQAILGLLPLKKMRLSLFQFCLYTKQACCDSVSAKLKLNPRSFREFFYHILVIWCLVFRCATTHLPHLPGGLIWIELLDTLQLSMMGHKSLNHPSVEVEKPQYLRRLGAGLLM